MHDGSVDDWGETPERHIGSHVGNKNDHVPTPSFQSTKRNRGMTQHQSAVVNHRKQQIDYSLDRRIRKAHERARDKRESESAIVRAWKRIRTMPPDYDSEEEAIKIRRARERSEKDTDEWRTTNHRTKDGEDFFDNVDLWRRPRMLFAGFVRINGEASDVGEESKSLAQSFRRVSRRLERWQDTALTGDIVLRRMEREAQGGFERRRPRISLSPVEAVAETDEPENLLDVGSAPVRATHGGRRQAGVSKAKSRRKSTQNVPQGAKADPEPAPDEDDGAAELDEEDREILGEVDADESEDDDEDENMED
jgi:Ino eighty subunit 1